jgi:hypothetical protein
MVIFYNVCECFQMCVCLVEALWSLLLNESYDSGVAVSTIFRNFQNANGFKHIFGILRFIGEQSWQMRYGHKCFYLTTMAVSRTRRNSTLYTPSGWRGRLNFYFVGAQTSFLVSRSLTSAFILDRTSRIQRASFEIFRHVRCVGRHYYNTRVCRSLARVLCSQAKATGAKDG